MGSSEGLWKNSERVLSLLSAESKQVRRKTLENIFKTVEFLPRNLSKSLSNEANKAEDSDDDAEEEEKEEKQQHIPSIGQGSNDAGGDASTPIIPSLEEICEIIKPLMKSLCDPMEKCRELSYDCLISLFQRLPKRSVLAFTPNIIPALLDRLGQQELIESSEEVRLLAIKFMQTLLLKLGPELAPFVDDWIRILSVTLLDPFQEVRKLSCEVTSQSAERLAHVFHYNSERLNKPLCSSITHQQSKVRLAVVRCIGKVLLNGNHKCIEEFIPHLTQRLFDPQPNVRKAVVEVVGEWMLDFVDRYSYFHKLMPLLITGLCDESEEVQGKALVLWEKVGEKYLEENLEEYKDQVDFPSETPKHYPDNVKRPNFGCRLLAQRNACKIIPGVTNDITDWVDNTRIKCAQLLFHLIVNCEDKITMHVQPIIYALFKSALDSHPIVAKYALESAKALGYFVPLSTTWPILSSYLSSSCGAEGGLSVSCCLIEGTEECTLTYWVESISSLISTPEICQTPNTSKQFWILRICSALTRVLQPQEEEQVQKIFTTIVTILALAQDGDIQGRAMLGLNDLKTLCSLDRIDDLFGLYSGLILDSIHKSDSLWTASTPDKLIFATILTHGGIGIIPHLESIVTILVAQVDPKKEPTIRLQMFTLLSEILGKYSLAQSQGSVESFISTIVEDVLAPNLVWRAGKTASALRAGATSCLLTILERKLLPISTLLPLSPKIVEGAVALLDDTFYINRLLSVQSLGSLALACGRQLEATVLNKIYPELLKRLDDEKDEVRLSASVAINHLFSNVGEDYDKAFFKVHLDYLMNVLLVHLDDEDISMQASIAETLKTVGCLLPELLIEKCSSFRTKHRSTQNCDDLILHFKSLGVN